MKPHVRDRCTITHIDSSLDSAVIATVRCVDHLLNKLNNTELRLALEAAKHRSSSSVRIKAYKEIQIHGPV